MYQYTNNSYVLARFCWYQILVSRSLFILWELYSCEQKSAWNIPVVPLHAGAVDVVWKHLAAILYSMLAVTFGTYRSFKLQILNEAGFF